MFERSLRSLLAGLSCIVLAQQPASLQQDPLQNKEIQAFDDQGRQLTVRIREAAPDPLDPDQEVYLYSIDYKTPTGTWENLCRPDAQGIAKAVVLQGSWDSQGNYHANPTQVSLSCTNGALGKCVRFGYQPWKEKNGVPLRDYHQACFRLVRADYCGDGVGHTKDGTPINIYDRLQIQTPDPAPEMSFEAVWGPEGAICINHVRWPEDLDYVQQQCPRRLAVNQSQSCQSSDQAQQNHPGGILFNDSVAKPGSQVQP